MVVIPDARAAAASTAVIIFGSVRFFNSFHCLSVAIVAMASAVFSRGKVYRKALVLSWFDFAAIR